jgi:nucleotide-binding universal stress UspA family protein
MFHTLLVPLDGSAFAEQALPLALALARQSKAALDLVRAHGLYALEDRAGAWAPYDPAEDAEFRRHEQGYLDGVARRISGEHPVRVTCVVADGAAADAILGRAREVAADLVVMTTHGRGPVSRAFLGSVADELVRRCPVPVLLVRPDEALPDLHRAPSVGRVLVPLDRSPASEQVLGPALQVGGALGAAFSLLHVVRPDAQPAPRTRADREAGLSRSCQEREAEEALAYLERLAGRLRAPSVEVRTRVVVAPHVATAVLEEARAQPCGLIALATHGRGGLPRLLLGSVADMVLRGASCPVLVLRGAGAAEGVGGRKKAAEARHAE